MVLLLACHAAEPTVRAPGIRVTVGDDDVHLDVPVRRLAREGGPDVVLAGAVHVADPALYAALTDALAGCSVVLREGLTPEPGAPAADDQLGPLLAARGLVRQDEALGDPPRWRIEDRSVAEVRAELRAAGASEDEASTLLDDHGQSGLVTVLTRLPAEPRSDALARFTVLSGIAVPNPTLGAEADRYWEVVVGSRDAQLLAEVRGPGPVGILYGTDHLADLEARLVRRGWHRVGEDWLPAITVTDADLQLGPAQIRQRLR